MVLSTRQQTAQALTHSISAMGAWVVSPLLLDDNSPLRFQVMDSNRDTIIAKLASWNWLPVPVSILPRITQGGWQAASIYQIDLPRDRQPIADDRVKAVGVSDDSGRWEKTPAEVEAIRKYLGWKT